MSKVEKILADLVAIPVLGGESNLAILAYITSILDRLEIPYYLVKNEGGDKASVHCRIGPAVDGGVILSGHMDVVPVEGQAWDTDPFVLTDKGDGKLYGRGSCDMKGFLACCIANLEDITQLDLKKPIYLAFSYDEEIGCLAAPALAKHINEVYHERPAYAIIGEPSMMQTVVGQKGICVVETIVNGSAGHSSRILQEVSAVHVGASLICYLESMMKKLVDAGHIDDRFTPPHSSIHIGVVNGGVAPNVIADKCSFKWDIRVIPQDKIKAIMASFADYCSELEVEYQRRMPEFKILSILHHPPVPPLDTADDSALVNWVQDITGNTSTTTVAYAAEAGQFAEAGFESIICGPGDIAQAHRANEFISKEQLQQGVDFILKLARSLT
jgi:acetylornithine deacetylase